MLGGRPQTSEEMDPDLNNINFDEPTTNKSSNHTSRKWEEQLSLRRKHQDKTFARTSCDETGSCPRAARGSLWAD